MKYYFIFRTPRFARYPLTRSRTVRPCCAKPNQLIIIILVLLILLLLLLILIIIIIIVVVVVVEVSLASDFLFLFLRVPHLLNPAPLLLHACQLLK